LFPILVWLPAYQWRTDLGADLVAGVTVAVMHIPQSMGYAVLAGVAPVYGLYTSFWPQLVYACMGTSRHVSMGWALVTSQSVHKQ
jgi:MFS superfamily sulfate permease-like transporter